MTESAVVTASRSPRSYRAKMYHARARIVKRGRVHLTRSELVFIGRDGGRFAVPLGQLRARSMAFVPRRFLRRGHRRSRSLFSWLAWWVMGMAFFHRERPHWFFHTRDLSILRDPVWPSVPETDRRVHEQRPRWIAFRKASFWLVLAFLGLWMFHPGFRETLSGPMVALIDTQVDARLGRDGLARMQRDGRLRLVSDPALLDPLRRVFARVEAAVPEAERVFDAEIHLADSPDVNAYALPGGQVIVLMGLLEDIEGEDALAGVLAHEIAHAEKRHHLRDLIEQGVCHVLCCMVGAEWDGVADWVGRRAAGACGFHFSRDQEREADRAAVSYMRAAGYDPEALARMFERWAAEHGDAPEWLMLISTHPDSAERAQRVRAWMAGQGEAVDLPEADREDWGAYRQRITAYFEARPGLQRPRP